MRILVADDQTRVRSALRVLIEMQPGLAVVAEAATAEEFLAETDATDPDLVLLDWELPDLLMDGWLHALRSACPHTSVVALSARPEARRAAVAAGVDAFVSKAHPPENLLNAIEACRHKDNDRQACTAS